MFEYHVTYISGAMAKCLEYEQLSQVKNLLLLNYWTEASL